MMIKNLCEQSTRGIGALIDALVRPLGTSDGLPKSDCFTL